MPFWSDSYHPLVEAHFEAAEAYEHAQLIAEIGIVLASLGVLLGSRPAWLASLVLALLCVGQLARTYVQTRGHVGHSVESVQQAGVAYQNLRKAHVGANDDADAVEALDPGGKLRATFPKPAVADGPAKSGH